ncbi:MAG: ferritin family protein [Syntrophorhabdales bacterium]|jgi:rubrerythrin
MNAYDYAMQLEKDGESYYREGARRSVQEGLRRIMTTLADAELVHYDIFKKMKEQKPWALPDTTILRDVKNIFVKMKEEGGLEGINVSEIDFYKKAQDIEKMTEDFYLERARQVEDGTERETFLQVAAEEKRHFFVLQQIIDFVSRPDEWLEDAEWYHLDEY